MRIAVSGGGIGGMAAALASAQAGHDVTVMEQAAALTAVGAGVQVSPNGMRVLRALGVAPPGLSSEAVVLRDGPSGRAVLRMPLPRGDWLLAHRADLLDALARAARAAGVTVRLGTRVTQVDVGGQVGGERFDRVIAADGLHSVARAVLNGAAAATFTGQVAYRAVIPGRAAPEAPEATVWMGPGRHLTCYPLRDGRLNLVGVEERSVWTAEGWHHPVGPAAFRAAFAGFAAPVRDLLAGLETVHLWGLHQHPVARTWAQGRLALLGDAAHPTLPFLAQGANLALEDAWVLSRHLDDLDGYARLRRPRVVRAIAAADANARNYHLSGIRRQVAQAVLRAAPPGIMLRRLDWLYGFDATVD